MKTKRIECWGRKVRVGLGWALVTLAVVGEGWMVGGLVKDCQQPGIHRPEPFALVSAQSAGLSSLPW